MEKFHAAVRHFIHKNRGQKRMSKNSGGNCKRQVPVDSFTPILSIIPETVLVRLAEWPVNASRPPAMHQETRAVYWPKVTRMFQ
mgnify:CR=1 FL=1